MRWVIALATLAACSYAPARVAGDAGDPGDATIADTPIDGPPGDPDGDGVPTAMDNCPTIANTNQHDEDDDATGDLCDPCPQLAGAADADGDGDGIGDGCDPRPGTAGDTLARFETFAGGAGLPLGWTSIAGTAGNWMIAGDALVNTGLQATNQIMLDVGGAPHSIDIGIEITAVNNTNDTIGVGALIDGDGTQSEFYMCFVQSGSAPQFTQLFGPGTTTLGAAAQAPTFPGRYRIATFYDGAQLRCRFGGTNAPNDLASVQPPLGNTRVGIRMRNTAVRIEYVAIYRVP